MSEESFSDSGSMAEIAGWADEGAAAAKDPRDLIEEHILPRLDPVFVQYFVRVLSKAPPGQAVPLEVVRADPDKQRSPIAIDTSKSERVADYVVSSQDGATISVRVYHPDPAQFGPGPYPVHMNHHGMSNTPYLLANPPRPPLLSPLLPPGSFHTLC